MEKAQPTDPLKTSLPFRSMSAIVHERENSMLDFICYLLNQMANHKYDGPLDWKTVAGKFCEWGIQPSFELFPIKKPTKKAKPKKRVKK